MIHSFGSRITGDLYSGVGNTRVRKLPQNIKESALYKLAALNSVVTIDELRLPPENRLEALKGNYSGFHSIRINA